MRHPTHPTTPKPPALPLPQHPPSQAEPVDNAMALPEGEWWFSQSGLIGFNWAAVIGYDYKPAGKSGYDTSSLYVYTQGGILRVNGNEGERLIEEMKGRVKAL